MHRSVVSAAAACALLACASAGTPAADRVGNQTVTVSRGSGPVEDVGGVVTLTRTDVSATDSLEAVGPPAMAALLAAYEALGIPATIADSAAGRVGNLRFMVRRRLGGTPLSRFVSCGTSLTGPRADTDRVQLRVVSTLRHVAGEWTRVTTTVAAQATDVSGTSADPQLCASTGALERAVNQRARTLAAAQ